MSARPVGSNASPPAAPPLPPTLDLRGVRCPLNLLKVKLALEPLEAGAELRVLLDPGEGMENVPRALLDLGHTLLETRHGPVCKLHIKKGVS